MNKKTILITGCSSGIGYDSAIFLKNRGYRVFATARKIEDVQKLKNKGFESFLLDLQKVETIENTLNQVLKLTEGKLDALFNNGAYGQAGAVEDLKTDTLREQFETNVFGWHELTRRVLPIMRKQGYGRIIQHSSILGLVSLKFRGAYNASKYAIEGLSDTLRQELIGTNIKVISLNTGPIKSNFRQNSLKAFQKNIEIESSYFKDTYKKEVEIRLKSNKDDTAFTLESDAVIEKLILAIESKKPKPRYYITFASTLLAYLKRVFSTNLLDKFLNKI